MKRFGLLTTTFLFTVSLSVYSRNFPVTLTSLQNHTGALLSFSSTSMQNGFQRSLNRILEKTKNNPFSPMTKETESSE
jgi:hypothetical protein